MKRGRRSIVKSYQQQKPEQSSDRSHCYSSIPFSKQKRVKLMKVNLLQTDDVLVASMGVWKFQIDAPKVWQACCWWNIFGFSETWEELEEADDDIDYSQVPSLVNSKLLHVKTIQVICFIFWTSLYSTKSHH